MDTGASESIGFEFKPSARGTGYDGIFEVAEIEQLFSYRFEDLSLPDATLRAELKKQEPVLGDQIPATTQVIERYSKAIQTALGGDRQVTGKLNSDLPGQIAI